MKLTNQFLNQSPSSEVTNNFPAQQNKPKGHCYIHASPHSFLF